MSATHATPSGDGDVPLPPWTPRARPPRTGMAGRTVRLEPLDPERHAAALFEAYAEDEGGAVWRFLHNGPFADAGAYARTARADMTGDDPLYFAIVPTADGRPAGVASFMRMVPEHGVIEIGNIAFAPRLQRTRAATETLYLMLRRAFDELGYRRCEWKCNNANLASRRAADRLGFAFEGVFRQHMVVKGRNRDTAWYAITDDGWPTVRGALEAWLDEANFDREGRQRRRLADIRHRLTGAGLEGETA